MLLDRACANVDKRSSLLTRLPPVTGKISQLRHAVSHLDNIIPVLYLPVFNVRRTSDLRV